MGKVRMMVLALVATLAIHAVALAAEAGGEAGGSEEGEPKPGDLAKAVQNPVADLISVPFQNNTTYNIGANERASNVLNIQPVIPIHLSSKVMLVTRTILPIVYQPDLTSTAGGTNGVGDLNPTFFFSPANPGKFIWGVGPALVLPTGTQRATGSGKWSAGPSAVGLVQPGHWTFGLLASQIWSFAGPDDRSSVSLMTAQYFVNYNLPEAWYLSSSPILTFDWKAPASEEWTGPVGGGVGKIFKLGKLPLNGVVQGYYNIRPSDAQTIGRWQARIQLAFLFPTKQAREKMKKEKEEEGSASARIESPPAQRPEQGVMTPI
jgi:hypothetical protein